MEFDEQLYLIYACVTQLVECQTENLMVARSNRAASTNTCFYSFWMCDKGRMSVLLVSLKLT